MTNIRSRIQSVIGGKEIEFLKAAKNLQEGFATLSKLENEKLQHQEIIQKLDGKSTTTKTAKHSATVDIYKLLSATKNKAELADQIEHNQIQKAEERENNKAVSKPIYTPANESSNQNTKPDLESHQYSTFIPR